MTIARPDAVAKCKALLFGPAGSGKTHFMGTLADDERTAPTLFLDFEAGVQSLAGRDMDVAVVRDWQDYQEGFALLDDPNTKYKSAAVDSLSETQVGGLLAILDQGGKRADPDQLAQADWGIILVQMRRFVRAFRSLPMHVFMSALSGDDLDPREGKVKVPLLQGSFANEAPGIFDVVAYMAQQPTDEGVERVLLLHSQPGFRVKARTPFGKTVPSQLEEPTAGALLDILGFTGSSKKGSK